ncbi:HAD hydrolase-like protein [Pseudonocardia sp. CA-107938]|uniref:HAD hydrolase-like protein n=1 Tax=Pseudonocardia sp. CA-107938 TaxID=3240021 RepID=UPI003D93EF40
MRTALLDLDGTLADSAALIVEHLAKAMATVGVPVPEPAVLQTFVGPPFETALPAIGVSAEQTRAVIHAYRESYDPVAAHATPIYPGVPETLQRLQDAGLRLAIATSKPEFLARSITAGTGLDRFLTEVVGADDTVGRIGKDKVVAEALRRLRIDPGRDPVIMVGDRHHDVDGAAAHGVRCIGVAWGYAAPGELAGAELVVPDIAELERVLLGDDIWEASVTAA